MIPIWFLIVGMLAASAFFSATETAYASLSRAEAETAPGASGRMVRRLLRNPDRFLATVLVGNNVANVAAAAAVALLADRLYGEAAVSIASGVLTLVLLVFAEVTPKRIAIIHDVTVARVAAYPMAVLQLILLPVVVLVLGASSLVTRFVARGGRRPPSLNAILHMVSAGESAGTVRGYESRMVKGVFRLDDTPVRAIMTHRMDVFALTQDMTVGEAVRAALDCGFSRIPVVEEESGETIAGVVLVKDLMREYHAGRSEVRIGTIMRRPIIVPETHRVNQVFRRLQRERLKMAIVLDEYGGFAGIVTLEDIAEEVFGEIYDEGDEPAGDIVVPISAGFWRISPDATLARVADTLGLRLEDSPHDETVAAWIMDSLGHVPSGGEVVDGPGFRFHVRRVIRRRIVEVVMEVVGTGTEPDPPEPRPSPSAG